MFMFNLFFCLNYCLITINKTPIENQKLGFNNRDADYKSLFMHHLSFYFYALHREEKGCVATNMKRVEQQKILLG